MDEWVQTKKFIPLDNGGFALQRQQDVEPILDENKRFQNEPQKKSELMGNHMMRIPNIIIEKWLVEEGFNFFTASKAEKARFLRKKYHDPDWRHLRVR